MGVTAKLLERRDAVTECKRESPRPRTVLAIGRAAGLDTAGRGRNHGSSQSTSDKPVTRENSPVLCVTSVSPLARAMAAMSMS